MEILFFLYNQGCYSLSTEYENYLLAEIQGAVILLRRTKLWLRGKTDGERLMYVCSCVATKPVCVCVCVCVWSCVPTKHSLAVYLNRQTRKQMRGSFIKGKKASPVHCTSEQMSKQANVSLAYYRKESKPQAATAKALLQLGDRTTLPTACIAPIPKSLMGATAVPSDKLTKPSRQDCKEMITVAI